LLDAVESLERVLLSDQAREAALSEEVEYLCKVTVA